MAFILLLIAGFAFAGGGWTQPKGGFYAKLDHWWTVYDQYYDLYGHKVEDRKRALLKTSIYGEYGVTPKLTVAGYFPFVSAAMVGEEVAKGSGQVLAEGDQLTTVGDGVLQVKYNLINALVASLSVSGILGIPTGTAEGGTDGTLWTGDGEWNQMLRADLGISIPVGDYYPYANGYVGYNHRTRDFTDELHFGAEAGCELGKWFLVARMDRVRALKKGELEEATFSNGLQLNNSSFWNLSAEVAYKFTELVGIVVGANQMVGGRQVYAGTGFSVGVFMAKSEWL
ncbi:hypothetical protein [Marinoscillum furvescens]|uniref:hypothetical protein n=1 Tax=Marinoscillum furvescens TaxID=1026 RepID=UPI001C87B2E6|nr:hypothetical protein [Marinoscillum furvescens]